MRTVELPNLTAEDVALTVKLAGCSLATNNKNDNWVDEAGGLPEYICEIARSIKKTGKTTSQAIAIAVSRVKKWAAGGDDVKADTRAKAAKALAQWEKMKAKSKGKTVAASMRHDGSEYICLSAVASYNVDRVREAFNSKEREKRELIEQANRLLRDRDDDDGMVKAIPCDYRYVREVWTDFLIVEDGKSPQGFVKIPYTVAGDGKISWGAEQPVVQTYTTVALSAGRSNPRPGKQVVSAEGSRKYGKPIGADIGKGGAKAPADFLSRLKAASAAAPKSPDAPKAKEMSEAEKKRSTKRLIDMEHARSFARQGNRDFDEQAWAESWEKRNPLSIFEPKETYEVGAAVKFKKNGVTGKIVSVGKPSINSGSNERVITWQDDKEGGQHVHRESMLEVVKKK